MPDLIVRLLGESAQYSATMATAEATANRFDRQLETLTSTMTRQAEAKQFSSREAAVLAIADKGASTASAEYALSVARQLDQLDQLAAAEARETAEKERARQATERAATENQNWIRQTISTEQQAAQRNQQSTASLKLKEAAQRGATDAETDAIFAALQLQQRNAQLTAAYEQRTAAIQRTTSASGAHSNAARTNMLAIQALAFGLQDAAQVYGTTGLAGAISASANNIIFMTSLLNPHLAIVTAVTVAVGQFAVVLGPAILGTKNQAQATEDLIKSQTRQAQVQTQINDLIRAGNRAMEEINDSGGATQILRRTESSLRDNQQEQAQIQETIHAELRARERRVAIRNEERRMMSVASRAAVDAGFVSETVSKQELAGYNARIIEQQQKLQELGAKELILQKQLEAAKREQAALGDRESQMEARRHAANQREEEFSTRLRINQEKREAADRAQKEFQAKRDDALQQLQQVQQQATPLAENAAQEREQRRAQAADELAVRLRDVDTWKRAQILSYQEATAARLAAEQAFLNQTRQAEIDFQERAAREKKQADAKAREEQKKERTTDRDISRAQSAVETNSTEAFRAVFNATNGGDGPLTGIYKETLANGRRADVMVSVLQSAVEVLKRTVVKGK